MACARSPRHPGHSILLLGATPEGVRYALCWQGRGGGTSPHFSLQFCYTDDFERAGRSGRSHALAKLLFPSLWLHPDLSMDEGPAFSLACFHILTSSSNAAQWVCYSETSWIEGVLSRRIWERERPLSGWQMLFLHEHVFPFNCLATISRTDMHASLSPFQRVQEGAGCEGKTGWGNKVWESTLPHVGELQFCRTGQAAWAEERQQNMPFGRKGAVVMVCSIYSAGRGEKVEKIGSRKTDSDTRPELWPCCLPCCPAKWWSRLGNRWRGQQKQLLQEGFVESTLARSHWQTNK